MNTEALLELGERYADHRGLTLSTVSTYAGRDGKILPRMKTERGGCTLRTANRMIIWFSAHWPEDLEWPSDIPRPPATPEAA